MSDTNDNDLIRFAAKAVGINALIDPHGKWRNCTNVHPSANIFSVPMWNPLTDDGDALRLAVKLRMSFHFEDQNGQECIEVQHSHNEESGECKCVLEPLLFDTNAATRRAITRAAAEIGRAMV